MAFTTLGMSGVAFNQVDTAPGFGLGTQAFGSDGRLYVYAVAAEAISADATGLAVDADTFEVAAAEGGEYTAPAVDVASGNYAWFSKASV